MRIHMFLLIQDLKWDGNFINLIIPKRYVVVQVQWISWKEKKIAAELEDKEEDIEEQFTLPRYNKFIVKA